jgi:hypothetical protein
VAGISRTLISVVNKIIFGKICRKNQRFLLGADFE